MHRKHIYTANTFNGRYNDLGRSFQSSLMRLGHDTFGIIYCYHWPYRSAIRNFNRNFMNVNFLRTKSTCIARGAVVRSRVCIYAANRSTISQNGMGNLLVSNVAILTFHRDIFRKNSQHTVYTYVGHLIQEIAIQMMSELEGNYTLPTQK